MVRSVKLLAIAFLIVLLSGIPAANAEGTWGTVTSPRTNSLESVLVVSSTEGWIVGWGWTVLNRSGSEPPSPRKMELILRLNCMSQSCLIAGRVFDSNNAPVANAVISIRVMRRDSFNGTSIHTAITHSNTTGEFQDSFVIPTEPWRTLLGVLSVILYLHGCPPSFIVVAVADKAGYDTAHGAIFFPGSCGRPTNLFLCLLFILLVAIVILVLRSRGRRDRRQSPKLRLPNDQKR